MEKIFAWQCHLERCGGDGRRLQDYEVVKQALKDLIPTSPNQGGAAFPSSNVLTEPPHLRMDKSRHGDIMAVGREVHRMDSAIDIGIASGLTKSCLTSSCKSAEYVLKMT